MNASLQNQVSLPLPSAGRGERFPDLRADNAEALRRREAYLAAAQRLSRTGSFGWKISTGELYWSEETYRIFEYELTTQPTVEVALRRIHPEDADWMEQTIERITREEKEFDFEFRLLVPGGRVKHLRAVAYPERDAAGELEFVGAVLDITASKAAEDKIRLMIDTVPAQMWTAGADGRLDFMSQRLRSYFGVTGDPSQERGYEHYVHPDDAAVLSANWRAKVALGDPFEMELRLRRFDGEYRWFLSCAAPARDRAGHITGWYGNAIDIHERKHAAEKLRESEAYLAEAQKLSLTGSWAWSPVTNKLRYWSEENFRLTGFDPRDGLPPFENVLERVPEEDRKEFVRVLEEAPRMKAEFKHEFPFVLPSGELRALCSIGHPVLDATGQLVEYVGTVIDQTERKRAEAALRASEERFRLIVENIPGLLCTHTAEGQLEFANQRLLDYTGRSLTSMQDWDWVSLIHPDDLPPTLQKWSHSVATGEPYDIEHRTRGADGIYRWFHVCGLPLRGGDGRIVRWYILLAQIDDRKKSEAALNKARTELAHITRITTMGELTASIAHEVNQPLSAVVNNANACLNLLPGGTPELDEVRDALAEIVEDADRAGAVLVRIRQLARRTPLEKSLLDLRVVVEDVLLLARGESSARQVTLHTELPEGPLPVFGDRVQLQQVLLNLVVNGMDAMSAVEPAARSLRIRARREGGRGKAETLVSVRDSGSGLNPEGMDRLFEAFYTTKPQGMGMGLSISRAIVEAHGGKLWAERNPEGGATFLFSLPEAGDVVP